MALGNYFFYKSKIFRILLFIRPFSRFVFDSIRSGNSTSSFLDKFITLSFDGSEPIVTLEPYTRTGAQDWIFEISNDTINSN